jgi:hypothetical protein
VLTREQILYCLHKFRGINTSDKDSRQKLIDCFVNTVYLYDDKVVLTYNYKDETNHISFEEIQSSDLDELARPKTQSLPLVCHSELSATLRGCKEGTADESVVPSCVIALAHIVESLWEGVPQYEPRYYRTFSFVWSVH